MGEDIVEIKEIREKTLTIRISKISISLTKNYSTPSVPI